MRSAGNQFSVRLGGCGSEELSLRFTAREHGAAQRWLACLRRAAADAPIHKPDQWYNFPGNPRSEESHILAEINRCIDGLNGLFAGLIPHRVDPADAQASVNRVHIFFADSHLGKFGHHPAAEDLWEDLNRWLHAHESCLRSRATLELAGIPEANFLVTWKQQFREPLREEDYAHFTVAKKFGTVYVNYCQIGRHFYEMFLSGDDQLESEHILPLSQLSADSYFWFGSTTGPRSLARKNSEIERWFLERAERFAALGFRWGDPRLAIGWLPVADLTEPVTELSHQNSLLREMARMDRVLAVE